MMTNQPELAEPLLAATLSATPMMVPPEVPSPVRAEAEFEAERPGSPAAPVAQAKTKKIEEIAAPGKTKIVVTLGPAMEGGDVIRRALKAGASVFRLNLACVERESALKAVYAIRSISTELRRPVSLLLDTRVSTGQGIDTPVLTDAEWADIRFGLECGVDWLAIPAGRNGEPARELRRFLAGEKRSNIGILARIEATAVPAALDQVIQDSAGVILGGGPSGGEGPDAETISAWSLVVEKCATFRKLAVIAVNSQADAAAALAAHPDALLLAKEAGSGPDPLESLRLVGSLILREEARVCPGAPAAVELATERDRTVAAAARVARETEVEAIVILTREGDSAALCAALRPRHARVFVFTPDARLARSLCLRYALEPISMPFCARLEATVKAADRILRERKYLARGASVVFITETIEKGRFVTAHQARAIA
jgi:pyruvate kinase